LPQHTQNCHKTKQMATKYICIPNGHKILGCAITCPKKAIGQWEKFRPIWSPWVICTCKTLFYIHAYLFNKKIRDRLAKVKTNVGDNKTSIKAVRNVLPSCRREMSAVSCRVEVSSFSERASGASPTIVTFNASSVKIYNATSSLARFGTKKLFHFEKTV
jgi:hypothetical protein